MILTFSKNLTICNLNMSKKTLLEVYIDLEFHKYFDLFFQSINYFENE